MRVLGLVLLLVLQLLGMLATPARADMYPNTLGRLSASLRRPAAAIAAYVPSAVTFTTETSLGVAGASLGANGGVDTPRFVISWWQRANFQFAGAATNVDANWGAYLLDIWGNGGQLPTSTCNSETCPGAINVMDNAGATVTMRLNINDATGSTNHSYQGVCAGCGVPWNDAWHHYLWVGDMGFANGSKRSALYVDGVKNTTYTGAEVGTIGSFNIALNSAFGWALNNHVASGSNVGAFDIADFFMDTHTTSLAGCSSLIDASNNVCPALLAKFYAGGPVDIGGASNCSTPLGSQPELCFSGDKTAFATNRGNATASLTLANNSTESGTTGLGTGLATPQLYNAPFGPSGPPSNRPYFVWAHSSKASGLVAATTSYAVPNSGGSPIAQGDLLLLVVQMIDSSTAFNRSIQTPTGWTAVTIAGTGNPYSSTGTHPGNYAVFYRVATAGDITASGSNWTSLPTIAWTANANALRGLAVELLDYKGANATTPVQAAAGQYQTSTSTACVAPTVTPTAAPATLVTICNYWATGFAFYPPASQDVRYKRFAATGGTTPHGIISDEALASTAATGARTAGTAQGSADVSLGINLVLGQ